MFEPAVKDLGLQLEVYIRNISHQIPSPFHKFHIKMFVLFNRHCITILVWQMLKQIEVVVLSHHFHRSI